MVGWLVGYVIRLYCFSSATRKRAEGRKVEFHKIESIFFHEVESQNKSKDRNTKRIKRLNQKIESQDRIKRLNHKIKSIFSQDQITRSKVFFFTRSNHKIKSQDRKYFFYEIESSDQFAILDVDPKIQRSKVWKKL